MVQSVGDGLLRISQRRRRPDGEWTDDAIVGEVDFESGSSVVELNSHGGFVVLLGRNGRKRLISLWRVGRTFSSRREGFSPALVHIADCLYHTC